MVLLRHLLGDALRRLRLRQGRTLREVSASARVSLGYLSEVERGQKEASSELLAAICSALGTPLSQVFREVSDNFALAELQSEPVLSGSREPSLAGTREPSLAGAREPSLAPGGDTKLDTPVARAFRGAVPASLNLATSSELSDGAKLGDGTEPVLDPIQLPTGRTAGFDDVARRIRDITDMVPV
jgi:transcriptional regulator with XRE-family HTH domain